jgi:hypothetical protein
MPSKRKWAWSSLVDARADREIGVIGVPQVVLAPARATRVRNRNWHDHGLWHGKRYHDARALPRSLLWATIKMTRRSCSPGRVRPHA